jgi:hypothetical protein
VYAGIGGIVAGVRVTVQVRSDPSGRTLACSPFRRFENWLWFFIFGGVMDSPLTKTWRTDH